MNLAKMRIPLDKHRSFTHIVKNCVAAIGVRIFRGEASIEVTPFLFLEIFSCEMKAVNPQKTTILKSK